MARTTFVNPGVFSNPRKRKGRKSRRRARRGNYGMVRRNAGITPFVQNPLILSNPRKRSRKRRANPLAMPTMKGAIDATLSYGGGTALALTLNTVAVNRIAHPWARRGVQLAAAVVGGGMLAKQASKEMSGAFAGAMMYPLIQDLMADLLGMGVGAGVAAKEADLDALAADLEDVLDGMDDDDDLSELSDDDDEEAIW